MRTPGIRRRSRRQNRAACGFRCGIHVRINADFTSVANPSGSRGEPGRARPTESVGLKRVGRALSGAPGRKVGDMTAPQAGRSEEHTSELQSQSNLVCRLLLEKKKKAMQMPHH